MGRELLRIGAPFRQPEWSALALWDGPDWVVQAHTNFIEAGAQVVTTNSYALVPFHIGQERFDAEARALAALSGELARRAAATAAGVSVAIRPGDTFSTTHRGHGHALANGVGLEPFLRQCIATLAEIYAVPCASVVRLDDAAGTGGAPMLTSHAVLQDGEFIGNLSYGVAGTPCERVLRDGLLCIGEGVADAFPEDTFLREMGIVGYYGVRLDSAAGETLGVVSMMSRAPLDPEPSIKPLIVAVAQRVATEIENRTRLHDLEQRVIERTRNLEQARLAALEASQAKSAFLSRVSHELRTPLNAIAGFSQLLDEEALVPGQKEMVGEIIQASSHLTRLIDEVLNISRIESGSLSLRRERLALPGERAALLDLDHLVQPALPAAVRHAYPGLPHRRMRIGLRFGIGGIDGAVLEEGRQRRHGLERHRDQLLPAHEH